MITRRGSAARRRGTAEPEPTRLAPGRRRGRLAPETEPEPEPTPPAPARRRGRAAPESEVKPTPPAPASASWDDCAHLIESICRFVGLADVLQCRLVCKSWYETLSPIQHVRRKFCCGTHGRVADFLWLRPERPDVHVCPPSIMRSAPQHPDATCWMSTIKLLPGSHAGCSLLSTAHGLLCFLIQFHSRSSLLVFNPATGRHRQLPLFSCVVDVESVGMRSDPLDKSYTIIVVGKGNANTQYFHDDGNPVKNPYYVAHVEIYSSKTGLWEHHSHFITDVGVKKGRIAWWQGQFYWIVHKPDKTLHLLAYDMSKREWIKTTVPSLPTSCLGNANCLLNWKGSLLARFPCSAESRYWQLSRDWKWKRADFLMEKPVSMHIVAHFSGVNKLNICIYDPYSFGPAENAVLSSRSFIVHQKRELGHTCFSFSPCTSMEV